MNTFPRKMFSIFISCFLALIAVSDLAAQVPEFDGLDSLAIDVKTDESRPFVFSDRAGAFYYGETAKMNHIGHQGFFVGERKYLADYGLSFDGSQLRRSNARKIIVHPDRIIRKYNCGLIEELTLLDLQNVLLLHFCEIPRAGIEFIPFGIDSLTLHLDGKNNLLLFSSEKNKPRNKLLAMGVIGKADFSHASPNSKIKVPDGIKLGSLKLKSDNAWIAIFLADDEKCAEDKWQFLKCCTTDLIREQQRRLQRLINDCLFETNDKSLNLSFYRALISLNQLIIHSKHDGAEKVGIYAGLPWFNNYWGRDTFISLPGAALVTGHFADAKKILLSFARFQNRDSSSAFWGRIPNRVTEREIIYNTADGTPWFVKALWDYYLYSGDEDFLKKMYQAVKLSVLGTFRYHCDSLNFLTHEDAETWMDAKGGQGAWSPRGDRAVEVQALWFQQLQIAAEIARLVGEEEKSAQWRFAAQKLLMNFRKYFWNEEKKKLYDHLKQNRSADEKIRPNQLFALTVPDPPLLSPQQEICSLEQVTTRLTYPYGVASLWQHDPDFHPYHQLPAFYPKDAAYHNGTVWTWLAGPMISSLEKFGYSELAFSLLKSEAQQILNVGAVGSYSELLDALPMPGKKFPRCSGTISQAWSLAEFIRNCYQDLLGVKPDIPDGKILLAPHFSKEITNAKFRLPLPDQDIFVSFSRNGIDSMSLKLNYAAGIENLDFEVILPLQPEKRPVVALHLQPGMEVKIQASCAGETSVEINGNPVAFTWAKRLLPASKLPELKFAKPELDSQLRALQPPPFPLLSGEETTNFSRQATRIVSALDSLNDDKGPDGTYKYPKSPYFKPGILDLKKFQVFKDSKNYYFNLEFRNLTQPGWHPEYGFQLTYVAIAIDEKSNIAGRKQIGRNANYLLPEKFSAERIIFIGGGFEIENQKGEIIAAYRPSDSKFAIGDVYKKRIHFAVPAEYLGNGAKKWNWAILVGAQDDHGGAGIGEFRCVGKSATEWQGGGAEKDCRNCNVYDFLFVQ